jgi:tetratricopeptide (TPR) repeat protein
MRYFISVAAIILAAWLTPPAHATDRDMDECLNAKDANRAIAACTRVIESGRGDIAEAYLVRGMTYDRKHALDRAISDKTAAIRLNPNPKNVTYFLARGDSYKWKGDYPRALADYNEAIRRRPGEAQRFSLWIRGCGYFDSGEYDRAIADFTTALGQSPITEGLNAKLYEARSRTYKAKGDHALALADHKEAIRLDPSRAAGDVCRTRPPNFD